MTNGGHDIRRIARRGFDRLATAVAAVVRRPSLRTAVYLAVGLAMSAAALAGFIGLGRVAVVGGHILNLMLKAVYDRPRPVIVPEAAAAASTSFPSGHAMSALVAYGAVAVLLGRRLGGCMARAVLGAAALAISIGVGISRIYLGVHYPSDVLAGFAIGLAWIAFVASTFRVARVLREGP